MQAAGRQHRPTLPSSGTAADIWQSSATSWRHNGARIKSLGRRARDDITKVGVVAVIKCNQAERTASQQCIPNLAHTCQQRQPVKRCCRPQDGWWQLPTLKSALKSKQPTGWPKNNPREHILTMKEAVECIVCHSSLQLCDNAVKLLPAAATRLACCCCAGPTQSCSMCCHCCCCLSCLAVVVWLLWLPRAACW